MDLRIGAGAEKLLLASADTEPRGRPEGHRDDFRDGQVSGPNGPQFVGFGEPVFVPLWRDMAVKFAWGLGTGTAIFVLMTIKPLLF